MGVLYRFPGGGQQRTDQGSWSHLGEWRCDAQIKINGCNTITIWYDPNDTERRVVSSEPRGDCLCESFNDDGS